MLGRHVVATGTGAVGGLIIGAVGGIALAVLMVQSRLLERILMPLLVIDQSIPKMALAPIFVIWFGAGMMSAHRDRDGYLVLSHDREHRAWNEERSTPGSIS